MVVFVSYGPSPAFGQKKSAPLGARCGDDPAAGRADNHRVGPLFLKIAAFCCSFICRWRRSSSAEYTLSSISRGVMDTSGKYLRRRSRVRITWVTSGRSCGPFSGSFSCSGAAAPGTGVPGTGAGCAPPCGAGYEEHIWNKGW